MESVGIPSIRTHAYLASLPSPATQDVAVIPAAVGSVEHLSRWIW